MARVRSVVWAMTILTVALGAFDRAVGRDGWVDELYADQSINPPTAHRMTVCYGFVCRRRYELDFTEQDYATIKAFFAAVKNSPKTERAAVAKTVAWFDRHVGPLIGTSKRVARADFRNFADAQNFDCIDTSTNATSLLLVLAEWGLLRHHRVDKTRYRGNFLVGQTPHNTAVLTEIATGQGWSIDMWTTNYGDPAEVMRIERWMKEN